MTTTLSPLTSPLLGHTRHGFFTREGGVSTGLMPASTARQNLAITHRIWLKIVGGLQPIWAFRQTTC